MKGVEFCQRPSFSASIEIIVWFLFLVLFMWWIMFIDLCMLNQAYLIVMDKLFDVLLQNTGLSIFY